MIAIDFIELQDNPEIERTAQIAAQSMIDQDKEELSIVFCNDEYIQQINMEYRQIDRPTDVLSFASDEIDPESGCRYLGDIIISYPRALEQSSAAKNPVTSEIAMLVVHGILHLRGFDHANESDKEQMWSEQIKHLHSLGIDMEIFTGDE